MEQIRSSPSMPAIGPIVIGTLWMTCPIALSLSHLLRLAHGVFRMKCPIALGVHAACPSCKATISAASSGNTIVHLLMGILDLQEPSPFDRPAIVMVRHCRRTVLIQQHPYGLLFFSIINLFVAMLTPDCLAEAMRHTAVTSRWKLVRTRAIRQPQLTIPREKRFRGYTNIYTKPARP